MRNRKNLVLLIICLVLIGFIAGKFSAVKAESESKSLYSYMRLFTEVLTKLEEYYIEKVDPEKLMPAAIEGMLKTLDPYTDFLTEDDYADLKTTTKGKFGGLGIRISAQDDYITIISPIEGTPAYHAGLMAGDQVVAVDGKSTKEWSASKAAKHMRGPIGTSVEITVKREGVRDELNFEIVRDEIKIESVPYAYKMKNNIGYIRITNFNTSTSRDLHNTLKELQAEGIKGLLLDLRLNPGGLLSQAIEAVDEFLEEDKLVVYTKGRKPDFEKHFNTKNSESFNDIPIIVLINEGSASASEIFAGSLQDWDKALIVGENSFGKGSVQQLFSLPMGAGIKITTSKYYIKSGRCIHKDRSEDVEDNDEKTEEQEMEKFYTVSGRIVYGGGGITPDIKILQDTLNSFEIDVRLKNLFFKFAVNFLATNEIDQNFAINDEIFTDFLNYIAENEIEYTDAELTESRFWLKNSLHAQIISNKFGLGEGNKIAATQDVQLQKTLELFEKFQTLDEMFAYANLNKI